jgi:hypothetical protein
MKITGIGSLVADSFEACKPILDLCDIPFLPELINLKNESMLEYILDYPISRGHRYQALIDYTKSRNSSAVKFQWIDYLTAKFYLNDHLTLDSYLLAAQSHLFPMIQLALKENLSVVLFIDAPIALEFNKFTQDELERYQHFLVQLKSLTSLYIHCCHQLTVDWITYYGQFGVSYDAVNFKLSHVFKRCALGVIDYQQKHLSHNELAHYKPDLLTPSCGLSCIGLAEAVEIFNQLVQLRDMVARHWEQSGTKVT